LRQFPALLRGTHIHDPRVDYFEGSELDVQADRPVPLAIDGDLVGTTPARFGVLPSRIRVLTALRRMDPTGGIRTV
jgi:diacylglycerol kinase family enzyme